MPVRKLTKSQMLRPGTDWRWNKKSRQFETWEARITVRGKEIRRRGFRTEQDAKDFLYDLKLSERAESIGLIKPVNYPLISEVFAKRLAVITNKQERIRADRVFRTFLSVTGDKRLNKIIKDDFRRFAEYRRRSVSEATINREINPIAKAFSSAPDHFDLPGFIAPRTFRFSKSKKGRERILSREEYKKFIEFFNAPRFEKHEKDFIARRRTGLIFQFMAVSGLRHGEVVGIRKDKLNRKSREIDIFRPKTDRWKKFYPLTDFHLSLFDQGEAIYPDSEFFFSLSGKIHNKTYTILKRISVRLGIPYGKRKKGGFILHDLRHTFSTILHANLIDDRTAAEFTDNPSALGNYQHPTDPARQKAMDAIVGHFDLKDIGEKEKELKKLFDSIRAGEMDFKDFKKLFD